MNVGYCFTGSFCTFDKSIKAMEELVKAGYNVTPIMSEISYNTDTRFGKAEDVKQKLVSLCKNDIIHTVKDAEPIGPKNMFDVLAVVPCTSNTLAKLALGINDATVTMAVKSHLRNDKPVVIGVSTNDAFGSSAKNIGYLMNFKNFYFVPMAMDNPANKPKSMVCDFKKVLPTIKNAVDNKQLQYLC